MNAFIPLWADGNWVQLAVPFVLFVFWLLSRILGAESPAARQQKARQQARPNPPQPPAERKRVEDEVGEFLRRAAQQRAGKESRPAPAPPPRPPKPAARPVGETFSPRRNGPGGTEEDRPRETAPPVGEPLVQRTITDRVVQPKEVTQAVEAMQSHVDQVFTRTVGSLAAAARTAEAAQAALPPQPAPAMASDLAAMLSDPQSIREAIVISEILRRPEERW